MQTISTTQEGDICIVQLDNGKVNAINLQMIQELTDLFKSLDADESVRGVIIAGKPHYFSAGLDIKELYALDEAGSEKFWGDFLRMVIVLTKFQKPLMSAITGFSPAGGCVIAVTCDYRIMADGEKYVIGLNEVPLAIMVTESIYHLYAHWIGPRLAHQYLLEGKLHTAKTALEIGLVDELVGLDDVLPRAKSKMETWLKADDGSLRGTRANIRKELIEKVDVDVDSILQASVSQWWSPSARAIMKAAVERLSK